MEHIVVNFGLSITAAALQTHRDESLPTIRAEIECPADKGDEDSSGNGLVSLHHLFLELQHKSS